VKPVFPPPRVQQEVVSSPLKSFSFSYSFSFSPSPGCFENENDFGGDDATSCCTRRPGRLTPFATGTGIRRGTPENAASDWNGSRQTTQNA
jgi:hypothetical protein